MLQNSSHYKKHHQSDAYHEQECVSVNAPSLEQSKTPTKDIHYVGQAFDDEAAQKDSIHPFSNLGNCFVSDIDQAVENFIKVKSVLQSSGQAMQTIGNRDSAFE